MIIGGEIEGILQEINTGNDANSEIQPLATEAKVL